MEVGRSPARPEEVEVLIHHVSLPVADLDRARRFYDAIAGTLGWALVWESPGILGYGREGEDVLNLMVESPAVRTPKGFHLAFTAPDRAAVDAFYAAALAHGGTDEGPPGLRTQYSPTYYAAFVRDPDGHKLEAVHLG